MEWTTVTVIIALVGLFLAVGAPIIRLIVSITKLTDLVGALQEDLAEFADRNSDAHRRLWDKNEEQDSRLDNHETRLLLIEKKDEG